MILVICIYILYYITYIIYYIRYLYIILYKIYNIYIILYYYLLYYITNVFANTQVAQASRKGWHTIKYFALRYGLNIQPLCFNLMLLDNPFVSQALLPQNRLTFYSMFLSTGETYISHIQPCSSDSSSGKSPKPPNIPEGKEGTHRVACPTLQLQEERLQKQFYFLFI